jgi:hypothetical protein
MATFRILCVLLLSLTFVSDVVAQKKTAKPRQRLMSNMQLKRHWIAADRLPYISDRSFPTFVRDKVLVQITSTRYHEIDVRLDRDGRYIRAHVLRSLAPLEEAYFQRFKKRLRITGAFRTQEHHMELRTRNNNAAYGNSPHETGCTVDISYLWMSKAEQHFVEAWFRTRHGKTLVVTKEYYQKVYDVFFRPPTRLPPSPKHRRIR